MKYLLNLSIKLVVKFSISCFIFQRFMILFKFINFISKQSHTILMNNHKILIYLFNIIYISQYIFYVEVGLLYRLFLEVI